jgi:hypothetical protein
VFTSQNLGINSIFFLDLLAYEICIPGRDRDDAATNDVATVSKITITETADGTLPTDVSMALDMATGVLTITFNEYVERGG